MEFDLANYDIYHIGVSGGKDSTAVLLWAVYESDIPRDKLLVSMCDTNNEDDLTYTFLDLLANDVFPIHYVYPERDFWELARYKKRFPSRRARFYTQHLKVIPSMRFVEQLTDGGKRVLMIDGIRREEAHNDNDRGNTPLFEHDDLLGVDRYHPVADWTLEDIWAIHQRHLDLEEVVFLVEDDPLLAPEHKEELAGKIRERGVPCNPLYYMGASRVGCFPCINSKKLEVRAMGKFRPERVDFIESQEGNMGREDNDMFSSFFARNMVPPYWRSKEITTADGRTMNVATIRDVVAWSRTAWGAKQLEFGFSAFNEDESPLACDMRGMCE